MDRNLVFAAGISQLHDIIDEDLVTFTVCLQRVIPGLGFHLKSQDGDIETILLRAPVGSCARRRRRQLAAG